MEEGKTENMAGPDGIRRYDTTSDPGAEIDAEALRSGPDETVPTRRASYVRITLRVIATKYPPKCDMSELRGENV